MLKFLRVAFALSGNRVAVPDAADPSGNVSYIEGYGPDYEKPKTNPDSKNIERQKMNGIFFDMTSAIAELQSQGVPDFITTTLNGGSPYPYKKNALARYSDGELYVSLVDANTALPTDTTKWALFDANIRSDLQSGFGAPILTNRYLATQASPLKADVVTSMFQANRTVNYHGGYAGLDNQTYDFTGQVLPIIGSASWNDNSDTKGNVAIDHHHSFQSYPHYLSSAAAGVLSSFWSQIDHTGTGTIAEASGLKFNNPLGTGPISTLAGGIIGFLTRGAVNNYGLLIQGAASGSGQNYALYCQGENVTSRFNGGLVLASKINASTGLSVIRHDDALGHLLLYPATGKQIKISGEVGNVKFRLGAPTSDADDATFENQADGHLGFTPRATFDTWVKSRLRIGTGAAATTPILKQTGTGRLEIDLVAGAGAARFNNADVQITTAGTGLILSNAAGTITKRVTLSADGLTLVLS